MSKKLEVGELEHRLAYSRDEAAAVIGCSVRHLIKLVKDGKLRESVVGTRMRRISRKELERFLAVQQQSVQSHESSSAVN